MKFYVGYVLNDYATAVFVSKSKKEVEEKLIAIAQGREYWIKEYTLRNKVIELDTF